MLALGGSGVFGIRICDSRAESESPLSTLAALVGISGCFCGALSGACGFVVFSGNAGVFENTCFAGISADLDKEGAGADDDFGGTSGVLGGILGGRAGGASAF